MVGTVGAENFLPLQYILPLQCIIPFTILRLDLCRSDGDGYGILFPYPLKEDMEDGGSCIRHFVEI